MYYNLLTDRIVESAKIKINEEGCGFGKETVFLEQIVAVTHLCKKMKDREKAAYL